MLNVMQFAVLVILSACDSTNYGVHDENLTVAKVQKEIKVGMCSADVVKVLGSPNMITGDDQNCETWVYDKASTSVQVSSDGVGAWVLLFSGTESNSFSSSTQRTLTIIVKFDEKNKVKSFSYRTSVF